MTITKIVKLNKKGQLVIPQEIREKMGFNSDKPLIIFTRGNETILLTPARYAELTCGLMKGTWGSTKKDIDIYINEERGSWK
ncbi:MAG: AbrB/MazE/SpoVT family DNA-binding domain-containing protein [Actinomycetia bacterium]|nr:AbrB/MazE/SpoVT family DNA-binding domain-containing protein [Actinomycetes bacterium]